MTEPLGIPKTVRINLNGVERATDKLVLSYEDIVEIVTGKKECPHIYTVTYSTKPKGDSRRSGCIYTGKVVEVEDGMVISAMITDNA